MELRYATETILPGNRPMSYSLSPALLKVLDSLPSGPSVIMWIPTSPLPRPIECAFSVASEPYLCHHLLCSREWKCNLYRDSNIALFFALHSGARCCNHPGALFNAKSHSRFMCIPLSSVTVRTVVRHWFIDSSEISLLCWIMYCLHSSSVKHFKQR